MTVALTGENVGQIGPNAVIQLERALKVMQGVDAAEVLFRRAGHGDLLIEPPAQMVDERIPARLFAQLWQDQPGQATRIAREAGRLTADYVIANRIPQAVKIAMKVLPSRVAAFLLLGAIRRNAWTFAGSGTCEISLVPHLLIAIKNNPIKMPECAWHTAVIERLFQRLVVHHACVRHIGSDDAGTSTNRFEIELNGRRRR